MIDKTKQTPLQNQEEVKNLKKINNYLWIALLISVGTSFCISYSDFKELKKINSEVTEIADSTDKCIVKLIECKKRYDEIAFPEQ